MKLWFPVWQMECSACGQFSVATMKHTLMKNTIDSTDRILLNEVAFCGRCEKYIKEQNTLIQRSEVPEELKPHIINL